MNDRPARWRGPGARRWRTVIVLIGLGLLNAAGGTTATAGDYTVRQCAGAGYRGFSGAAALIGGIDRVDFTAGCSGGVPGQFGIAQDRTGGTIPEGVGGEFRWEAPDEAGIVATTFDLRMRDANGILATPVGWRPNVGLLLDGGGVRDGSRITARWSDPGRPLSWVAARLVCRRSGGCDNRAGATRAEVSVFDSEFVLTDGTWPELTSGGSLWDWADREWHHGVATGTATAGDGGGGISRVMVEINGTVRGLGSVTCPGLGAGSAGVFAVSTRPCPATVTRSDAVDTSLPPFREGANQIRFCAEDVATGSSRPNRRCGPRREVLIDSLPPGRPAGLTTVGGSDWRAARAFEFTWGNPQDQGSPVTGGRYRLVDRSTRQEVDAAEFGPAAGRLGPVTVPRPGEYELELRLRDAAGNLGAAAVTLARFDDQPPSDVRPESPPGWISADELPLLQRIERAVPRGPSGVRGYALAVGPERPVAPCPTGRCLAPPISLDGGPETRTARIHGLGEGDHWISSVAINGAAVPSANPGALRVRVDRTAPEVRLDGMNPGWSRGPVTVTATATDLRSGMLPRPREDDGEPETVIQVNGEPPRGTPGPTATATVRDQGVNVIRYWARDLAGNAGDGGPAADGGRHPRPGEALVRIDTVAPEVSFSRDRDPGDPELVTMSLSDEGSGPAGGRIRYRRVGTDGPFLPLATRPEEPGRFTARIPSDDLLPGHYEFRGEGSDRAGNAASGNRADDGRPMLLRLPLKPATTLRAGFGPRRAQSIRVGYRRAVPVTGRLTAGRDGLADRWLTIRERLDPGSRPTVRAHRVRTGGDGRFSLWLPAGPSRRVAVLYRGSNILGGSSSGGLRAKIRGKTALQLRPARLRNGGTVRMTGRVARHGARLPAGGKLVSIEYFDPARRRWRPVELIRTDRRGRFAYRYRFRTIATAQRILFRATSPPEGGWPYLPGASPVRTATVLPARG